MFYSQRTKFLGVYTSRVMEKLSAPALQSSRNNVELADAFAELDLSNARRAQNKTLRSVNSKLRNTNSVAAAFVDPTSLTTRTTNNGFEEVVAIPSNVNQSEINAVMEEARAQALYNNMPSAPKTKPRAKGGYRKIKKSRKRVYA